MAKSDSRFFQSKASFGGPKEKLMKKNEKSGFAILIASKNQPKKWTG